MKKAIYIHHAPRIKTVRNILGEPWPEGGLTDQQVEEEALAIRLWLTGEIPGTVYDKVIEGLLSIEIDKILKEGEKEEDHLFNAADSLMKFYAKRGAKEFKSRFGSLEVLEVCRKIIREGEGNPHPWEEE